MWILYLQILSVDFSDKLVQVVYVDSASIHPEWVGSEEKMKDRFWIDHHD